jgi:alpha-glucosidase
LKAVNAFHCKRFRFLVLPAICVFFTGIADIGLAAGNELKLESPDGKIIVTLHDGDHLKYNILFHDKLVVTDSTLGIIVDGRDLGEDVTFGGAPETRTINEKYPVMGVHRTATNHCNSSVIPISSGNTKWRLAVRVFDDGVAYRYQIPGTGARHIDGESSEWNVPVGSRLFWQDAANTSYESKFQMLLIGQSSPGLELMAPATLQFPGNAGYGMMTEANLINYSDMSLRKDGGYVAWLVPVDNVSK